jgi:hypothetical protein
MWILTKYGFFSAVCARQGTDRNDEAVDRDRIMVRARLRGHLEALKERFPDLLGDCEILESVGTDYAFRLFVHKPAWVKVVAMLVEETDYDNFKSQVARHRGRAGTAYERSLHEVWSVMHRLQKWGRTASGNWKVASWRRKNGQTKIVGPLRRFAKANGATKLLLPARSMRSPRFLIASKAATSLDTALCETASGGVSVHSRPALRI